MTADKPRCRDLRPRDVIVWTGTPRPKDAVKVISHRKDDDSGWWVTDGSGIADYVWDDGAAWTTVPALIDAVQRRDDALAAVLALHTRANGYSNGADFDCCGTCFDADEQPEPWPCATVAAITAHLAHADSPTTEEDR